MVAELRSALEAGGFPGAALSLEVAEETLLRDSSTVAAAFSAVNALGVEVVLDRFGSGQASVNVLRRFRLSGVKLDAALATAEGRDAQTLVPALLRLASALSLPVIAAGLETEEQRARLHLLGCAEGQGPLLAKALEPTGAEALLVGGGGRLPILRPGAAAALTAAAPGRTSP